MFNTRGKDQQEVKSNSDTVQTLTLEQQLIMNDLTIKRLEKREKELQQENKALQDKLDVTKEHIWIFVACAKEKNWSKLTDDDKTLLVACLSGLANECSLDKFKLEQFTRVFFSDEAVLNIDQLLQGLKNLISRSGVPDEKLREIISLRLLLKPEIDKIVFKQLAFSGAASFNKKSDNIYRCRELEMLAELLNTYPGIKTLEVGFSDECFVSYSRREPIYSMQSLALAINAAKITTFKLYDPHNKIDKEVTVAFAKILRHNRHLTKLAYQTHNTGTQALIEALKQLENCEFSNPHIDKEHPNIRQATKDLYNRYRAKTTRIASLVIESASGQTDNDEKGADVTHDAPPQFKRR